MWKTKQLLWFQNSTLLQNTISQGLVSKAKNVYCVLGANSETIKNQVTSNQVTFIDNANWKEGLSSSIVAGINYVLSLENIPDAVLIMLADQPFVDSDYLDLLMDKFLVNTDSVITSDYGNKNGVPAIFPKKYFNNLLKLKGDKGAKAFLNANGANIISILPKYKETLIDIDSPEDYVKLLKGKF